MAFIIVGGSKPANGVQKGMTCVRFGLRPRKSKTLGPAPSYLISGDTLCIGPVWSVAAVYREHVWEFQGQRFVRFEFVGQGLTLADLDGASNRPAERFGPFDNVIVVDGVILADNRPFAKFVEETFAWYILERKICLLNIVIGADHESTEAINGFHPTSAGSRWSDRHLE
jgi:hypothetical protein